MRIIPLLLTFIVYNASIALLAWAFNDSFERTAIFFTVGAVIALIVEIAEIKGRIK